VKEMYITITMAGKLDDISREEAEDLLRAVLNNYYNDSAEFMTEFQAVGTLTKEDPVNNPDVSSERCLIINSDGWIQDWSEEDGCQEDASES
jgi:hypothetical protein